MWRGFRFFEAKASFINPQTGFAFASGALLGLSLGLGGGGSVELLEQLANPYLERPYESAALHILTICSPLRSAVPVRCAPTPTRTHVSVRGAFFFSFMRIEKYNEIQELRIHRASRANHNFHSSKKRVLSAPT